MRRRRGIWIVGLLAAALCAAVGAHASSAARSGTRAAASTLDKTYSCKVRPEHFISINASVTLPPANNQPAAPGVLSVTTAAKTTTHNGTTVTVSQVSFLAAKNSLRIDTSTCHRVKQQIPLKPKGLPTPATTVTPTLFGRTSAQCNASARVLVRLRLTTTNHVPTRALLAIRNENAKNRPIALFKWSPSKLIAYTNTTCH